MNSTTLRNIAIAVAVVVAAIALIWLAPRSFGLGGSAPPDAIELHADRVDAASPSPGTGGPVDDADDGDDDGARGDDRSGDDADDRGDDASSGGNASGDDDDDDRDDGRGRGGDDDDGDDDGDDDD